MTLLVAALTLGATTSTPGAAGNRDLGHGVTADSVKIGFAVVDYDAIKDFVDYNLGDEKKVINTFVDYLNKNGGVDGRKIVPDIKVYPPIPGGQPNPLSLCTSWAEDDDVFAVLGVFIDFTGQGQLCLTKEHDVVHIGYELDQPWIDEAKGGLLLTPDETKEQAAAVVVNLLAQTGKLKGKTVAVMGDKNSESRVNDIVVPAVKKAGAKAGSTAIVTITGTDTTAAQSQLDSFIEKWKSEGVNTVFLAGNDVSAKQFVETIKHSLPKVQLVTDTDTTIAQGRDETAAGTKPNPYEGILTATGLTQSERWANKNPLLQQCVDIYQKATGETIPAPDSEKVDSSGKKVQLDVAVTDVCGELFMFRDIARKVGPNLTPKTWRKTVDSFGPIQLVPNQISSLCKGKYAANDGFRLVSFDSALGDGGDWKKVTAIKDASNGKCAKAAGSGT